MAALLEIPADALVTTLTTREVRAQGSHGASFTRNLKAREAAASRDSMMKQLWLGVFGWVVDCCRESIASATGAAASHHERSTARSIGILDIYGFESFGDANGFEQRRRPAQAAAALEKAGARSEMHARMAAWLIGLATHSAVR